MRKVRWAGVFVFVRPLFVDSREKTDTVFQSVLLLLLLMMILLVSADYSVSLVPLQWGDLALNLEAASWPSLADLLLACRCDEPSLRAS